MENFLSSDSLTNTEIRTSPNLAPLILIRLQNGEIGAV